MRKLGTSLITAVSGNRSVALGLWTLSSCFPSNTPMYTFHVNQANDEVMKA